MATKKVYQCSNCLKVYRGVPSYKGKRIKLCCRCVLDIKKVNKLKSLYKNEDDINPYPEYSYNSGICHMDGTPVYDRDIRCIMFEIEHGRIPYNFVEGRVIPDKI